MSILSPQVILMPSAPHAARCFLRHALSAARTLKSLLNLMTTSRFTVMIAGALLLIAEEQEFFRSGDLSNENIVYLSYHCRFEERASLLELFRISCQPSNPVASPPKFADYKPTKIAGGPGNQYSLHLSSLPANGVIPMVSLAGLTAKTLAWINSQVFVPSNPTPATISYTYRVRRSQMHLGKINYLCDFSHFLRAINIDKKLLKEPIRAGWGYSTVLEMSLSRT